MAAVGEAKSWEHEHLLTFLRCQIELKIQSVTHSQLATKVNVIKRNKNLGRGDFSVIVPNLKKCQPSASGDRPGSSSTASPNTHPNKFDLSKWHIKEPSEVQIQLVNCGEFAVSLHRSHIFQACLSTISSQRNRYGYGIPESLPDVKPMALINPGILADCVTSEDLTLDLARSLLLSQHISALLCSQGYEVKQVPYSISATWSQSMNHLGLNNLSVSSDVIADVNAMKMSLQETMRASAYCVDDSNVLPSTCLGNSSELAQHGKVGSAVLDIRRFLQERHLQGKDGYNANLSSADFSLKSEILSHLSQLEICRRKLLPKRPHTVVHIVPRGRKFHQELVDIGWQILMNAEADMCKQRHVSHGSVAVRSGQRQMENLADFLSLRRSQMKEAAILKYGAAVQGPEWEAAIDALTAAGIKVELLSTSTKQQVKLDLLENSESVGSMDSKGGIFIMYNCARLENLFRNFEAAVAKGIYPPIPDVSHVDFSLLREEDEWALLFNYLLPFPVVLEDSVCGLQTGKLRPPIHTHKVCQFLQDLCRDLSSYYSRVHILGEPRPHLLPVMFARLWLMRGVRQVVINCLALLNIEPIAQL